MNLKKNNIMSDKKIVITNGNYIKILITRDYDFYGDSAFESEIDDFNEPFNETRCEVEKTLKHYCYIVPENEFYYCYYTDYTLSIYIKLLPLNRNLLILKELQNLMKSKIGKYLTSRIIKEVLCN